MKKRVDEKIIVDSADVERATNIAVKRKKATVKDIVFDGKIVDEEILTHEDNF